MPVGNLEDAINQRISSAGASGAGSTDTAPPQTAGEGAGSPAPTPVPSATTGAGTSPPPAQGTPPAGAPPSPQQWKSILDVAREMGYQNIPEGASEHQFLQHLLLSASQVQQYQQLANYGQEFLRDRDSYTRWKQEQQRQQEIAQQGQKAKWWDAPEFDPRWRNQVYRDPQTGELRTLPGASPSIVEKLSAWQQFERDQTDKLLKDPIGTLRPGLEEVVGDMIAKAMQQQQTQFQDLTFSQQFLRDNASWLYDRDQAGNQVNRLSQWGQVFKGHVDSLLGMGMRGDEQVANLALQLTEHALLSWKYRQQQGQQNVQTQGQQQKEDFLRQAATTQTTPAQTGSPLPVETRGPQNPSLGLQDRLRQKFQTGGVTDQMIQETLNRRAG